MGTQPKCVQMPSTISLHNAARKKRMSKQRCDVRWSTEIIRVGVGHTVSGTGPTRISQESVRSSLRSMQSRNK
jgi:hypothetical protein